MPAGMFRRLRRGQFCAPKFEKIQPQTPKSAFRSRRDLTSKLWRDEDRHVIEVGQDSDAVRVGPALPSELPQACFQLS